jgi:glycolate oxidase FAD binding subunit
VLERSERELRGMAEPAGAANVSILRGKQVAGAFGRKREFVGIALESSPAAVVVKASVLPSRMSGILTGIDSAVAGESLRWAAMARGVGIIYAALLPNTLDEDALAQVQRVMGRIQGTCGKAGGHATIPWCPAEWKPVLKIYGTDRGDLDLMRKLKSVFDPQGILSPGRFVGGL